MPNKQVILTNLGPINYSLFCKHPNPLGAMLVGLFVSLVALLPCSLVRFFFAGIPILGRFFGSTS